LNEYADYLNRIGKGKRLTKEEAIALIRETEKIGLVHLSMNLQASAVICSCCGCCCPGLQGILKLAKKEKLELGPEMNFRLVLDEDKCSSCEACIERCWTKALRLEDEHLVLNPARCIGCGACVHSCPADALCLERKPQEETTPTPRDFSDLFSRMGWRVG
jgi:ferredoxin